MTGRSRGSAEAFWRVLGPYDAGTYAVENRLLAWRTGKPQVDFPVRYLDSAVFDDIAISDVRKESALHDPCS